MVCAVRYLLTYLYQMERKVSVHTFSLFLLLTPTNALRLETGCQNFLSMWHLVARAINHFFLMPALEAIKKLVPTSKLSTVLHGVKVSKQEGYCTKSEK